jgi:hypothetical protein
VDRTPRRQRPALPHHATGAALRPRLGPRQPMAVLRECAQQRRQRVRGLNRGWRSPPGHIWPGRVLRANRVSDGRQLVFAYGVGSTTVYRSDDLSSPPDRILGGEPVHDLALSPQGDRLAVVLGDQEVGRRIAVLDVPTGLPRTVSGLDASHVRWAPDGEALYATASLPEPDGHLDLAGSGGWTIAFAGGLRRTPLAPVRSGADGSETRRGPSARFTRRTGGSRPLGGRPSGARHVSLDCRGPMVP